MKMGKPGIDGWNSEIKIDYDGWNAEIKIAAHTNGHQSLRFPLFCAFYTLPMVDLRIWTVIVCFDVIISTVHVHYDLKNSSVIVDFDLRISTVIAHLHFRISSVNVKFYFRISTIVVDWDLKISTVIVHSEISMTAREHKRVQDSHAAFKLCWPNNEMGSRVGRNWSFKKKTPGLG